MNHSNRLTIKQIASLAGVSTQTISRVINGRPDVSPETRKRVQEIIDRHGYKPSAVARSLIQQRSYTLGVVTAGLKYFGPSLILHGITDQAEELDYSVLLKELPRFDTDEIEPIFHALLARHVDGIIWAVPAVGDNQRQLKQWQGPFPVPLIFLTEPPRPDLASVDYDNYLGGKMATRSLLEQGCRRIGHISGPLDWLSARQRKKGWQDALLEAGIDPYSMPCVEGNWSSASGEPAFRQLLSEDPHLEAVFVANDQMAISVLHVACEAGIRVPQDLAVVGFDGLAESAYFWPPLTTLYQDLHALGSLAVKEIVHTIETRYNGEDRADVKRIVLQPKLIERASSLKQQLV
jgi:LacI family transcriptional regulator